MLDKFFGNKLVQALLILEHVGLILFVAFLISFYYRSVGEVHKHTSLYETEGYLKELPQIHQVSSQAELETLLEKLRKEGKADILPSTSDEGKPIEYRFIHLDRPFVAKIQILIPGTYSEREFMLKGSPLPQK